VCLNEGIHDQVNCSIVGSSVPARAVHSCGPSKAKQSKADLDSAPKKHRHSSPGLPNRLILHQHQPLTSTAWFNKQVAVLSSQPGGYQDEWSTSLSYRAQSSNHEARKMKNVRWLTRAPSTFHFAIIRHARFHLFQHQQIPTPVP